MSHMDLIEQHALELSPQPEGFTFFRWQCCPVNYPTTIYYELTGSIAPPLYKSGPRKGRHNWKLRDKATERTLIVVVADHEAWRKKWQEQTGNCLECCGTKQTWTGWNKDTGHSYQTCKKCNGTGKAIP